MLRPLAGSSSNLELQGPSSVSRTQETGSSLGGCTQKRSRSLSRTGSQNSHLTRSIPLDCSRLQLLSTRPISSCSIRQSEFALENAKTFSSQMSPVLMTYGCTGSTQSELETLERAKAKENRISVAKTRATGGT